MAQITQKTRSTPPKSGRSGLIIGKFYPPHSGHKYLIDFAKNYVDDLTVLVCSIKAESIDGKKRLEWMKKMFPGVNVVHTTDENPQYPEEHKDFWKIWKKTIKKAVPEGADYLFASEDYGWKLAEVLGMKYIPVNHNRDLVPVSGTDIRKEPMKNWKYIPEVVRPHFAKRVCVFGPESTGKTTLTINLAKKFKTVCATEYARDLLAFCDGDVKYDHIPVIARGHFSSEEALAKNANKVLFSDTDVITTVIWSNILFGKCPKWIEEMSYGRKYDLYLLLDVDTPYIPDCQRYLPKKRKCFFDLCEKELKKRKCNYVVIRGNWKKRLEDSSKEVDNLLQE